MSTEIREKLYEWIKQGEHETLDFKLRISDPSKIARTIVAFANHKGGTIMVGVDDFGELIGVDVQEEQHILRLAANEYCSPPLSLSFQTIEIGRTKILLAEVEQSDRKMHAAKDEDDFWWIYQRKDDQSRLLDEMHQYDQEWYNSHDPIDILSEDKSSLINYLDKHDRISIKEYMNLMRIPYEVARRSLNDLVRSGILIFIPSRSNPYYRLNR